VPEPMDIHPILCFQSLPKILTFAAKLDNSGNLMKTAILGHLTPSAKIVFVLMLLITGLILTLGIGILLAIPLFHVNLLTDLTVLSDVRNPVAVILMKYLQIVQSFGIFIFPPLMAGYLFEKNALGYFGMKKTPKVIIIMAVFLLMFFSIPFINWLVSINESMNLPSFLRGVEQWMKDAEAQASQLTDAFLDVHTAGGFLFNILMMAVLPAIGEELLFRGLLQRLFGEWFKNIHAAIFITAFIFGVVHLQFYGLLPRMILGVIFGYLFYWTGSLWVPVFAHFLNNAAVVVVSFLANQDIIRGDYENFGNTGNLFLIAGSVMFSILLTLFIYRKQKWLKSSQVDIDQGI
jgi:membrane protease YdiL (CAAX protease family)